MTLAIFGGVGLAARRLAFGPDTLVTVAHDHVAVRTPSQPDWQAGNALHLLRPPGDVATWLGRCATTVGNVPGVETLTIAWEIPADTSPSPAGLPDGATVRFIPVHHLPPGAHSPIPSQGDSALDIRRANGDERVWAGARALMLHAGRGKDTDRWRWHQSQEQALVDQGRGDVWVAYREQVPVARVAVWHDQADLAVLTDLVVHPLHRGGGLGGAFVSAVTDLHRTRSGRGDVICLSEAREVAPRGGDRAGAPPSWDRVATVIEVRHRARSALQVGPNVPR